MSKSHVAQKTGMVLVLASGSFGMLRLIEFIYSTFGLLGLAIVTFFVGLALVAYPSDHGKPRRYDPHEPAHR